MLRQSASASTRAGRRRRRVGLGGAGHLREAGNLIFHLSLVGILTGFAVKGYYGYQAKVVVTEGGGFTNIAMYYDDHSFGGGVDPDKLPPFGLSLKKFTATYEANHSAPDYGQARDFTADVTYNSSPTSPEKKATLKENSPLSVDGVSIYLSSHGYSPIITVRDKTGKAILDHQPVEFFDSGAMGLGSGIYKLKNGYVDKYGSPQQLGLSGIFIPDYPGEMVPGLGAVSLFPTASNPALVLSAYSGELGANPGVYTMNVSNAQRVKLPNPVDPTNPAVVLTLDKGKNTVALPDGTGTIEFDGVRQWAQFDLNHDPSKTLVFVSAVGIIIGLLGSLGIRRRRVFVRVRPAEQDAVRVEVAGLARAEDARLRDEVRGVGRGLRPPKAGVRVINESLARFSNYAVYGAMFVYLIAFFAYTAEWVFGRSSSFVVETAAGAATAAKVPAQTAVLAGSSGKSRVRDAVPGPEGSDGSDGSDDFDDLDDLDDLDGLADTDEPTLAIDGGNVRAITAGGIAVSTTVLGFALHVIGVVCRGLAAHRVPWGNLYEFTIAGSAVAMALYVGLLFRKNARWLGVFVTGVIVAILGVAMEVLYKDAEQLVPALHSPWLVVHVAAAVLCSGMFTVATVATVLYLFKTHYETKAKLGTANPNSMWSRIPSAMKLDLTAYRILAFTFPVWTFTVIAGSIWAERAWGRYWGWDPTETWAFITWVRLRRLPARPRHRAAGRAAAPHHRPSRLRLLHLQLLRGVDLRQRPALLRRSEVGH